MKGVATMVKKRGDENGKVSFYDTFARKVLKKSKKKKTAKDGFEIPIFEMIDIKIFPI